ncbi:molybdopterin-dependent oxidoreductase [Nonomuraea turkmeniaca]|uniref:molybdopterin oxidoreductase family protein n=1 Tax=Nonomuraea turkmeniaca TaxID=103838 RepID=UPI0026A03B44
MSYDRLTHPLVRENGVLRRATWEEALERAAEGFRRNIAAHGPDSFAMLSCARSTNEMNHVGQKFTRVVIGTNNVDSCNRTCHAPSVAGLSAVFGSGGGTSSYQDVEDTDVIVMWGSAARNAHPIFFQHMLKGIRNGARMFAVDPRRTGTAQWADLWLGLNVGTDIPLAHAVAREIIHAGLPNRLPGFQDILVPSAREPFEGAWGTPIQPRHGLNLTQMLEAMAEGEVTTCYLIGENPVQSEADSLACIKRLSMLDHLVVQDIFLTKTAQMADVVLPASAAWCEADGRFTNSERRVQRVRKALDRPGEARDDIWIMCEIARRLGHDWHYDGAEEVWNELRALSPRHKGMTYERLAELQGIQWPCPSEDSLEPPYLHALDYICRRLTVPARRRPVHRRRRAAVRPRGRGAAQRPGQAARLGPAQRAAAAARHRADGVRAGVVRAGAEGGHGWRASARRRVRAVLTDGGAGRRGRLTLIGFLRETSMNVYAGERRLDLTSGAGTGSAGARLPG